MQRNNQEERIRLGALPANSMTSATRYLFWAAVTSLCVLFAQSPNRLVTPDNQHAEISLKLPTMLILLYLHIYLF